MISDVKIALVTGASVRIGHAFALSLAKHGWAVAVHYRRSAEQALETVREIQLSGGKAAAFAADLSDITAVQSLLPEVADRLGRPSLLINNASLYEEDEIGHITPKSWQAHLDTNLRAPVFLSQAFAEMLPPGQTGNIVNIVDQRVLRPAPGFFSYTASKAALWATTRTMAQALAPRIRVNAIGPGPVMQSIHQTPEIFEAERNSTLLGCGASPDELCAALHFILATPSITGQMITLDGGQHLTWR